jgi:hypothetical protein
MRMHHETPGVIRHRMFPQTGARPVECVQGNGRGTNPHDADHEVRVLLTPPVTANQRTTRKMRAGNRRGTPPPHDASGIHSPTQGPARSWTPRSLDPRSNVPTVTPRGRLGNTDGSRHLTHYNNTTDATNYRHRKPPQCRHMRQ